MYDFTDKKNGLIHKNNYMLARTLSMFDYENLPETIPEIELEKMLQKSGYAFITEVDGELYAFNGGFGGVQDVYGNHTEIIITNPALKLNETYNLKEDGVLILNDDLALGLLDLYSYYHSLMIENDITMLLDNVNNRIQTLISASDNNTIESAKEFLKDIQAGKMGIVAENAMFEGLKVNNNQKQNAGSTTSLIELQQYLKASLYNEIGLNANFNMKRERLSQSEVEMNTDNLFPLVDNMLKNRAEAIEKLNEKYGLEVTVDFGSVWKTKDVEMKNFESEEIGSENSDFEIFEETEETEENEIENLTLDLDIDETDETEENENETEEIEEIEEPEEIEETEEEGEDEDVEDEDER